MTDNWLSPIAKIADIVLPSRVCRNCDTRFLRIDWDVDRREFLLRRASKAKHLSRMRPDRPAMFEYVN